MRTAAFQLLFSGEDSPKRREFTSRLSGEDRVCDPPLNPRRPPHPPTPHPSLALSRFGNLARLCLMNEFVLYKNQRVATET